MGTIESLIYMIWRGIAIGIIISAPMGPVGILCVQRTLEKGRKAGFYTGVGAALSDLFYCLLTGFGLSFIEEFLTRNSNIIQLVGSVVLIGFGVYLFKSNPSKKLKKPIENDRIPAGRNILNGFLFTFSNPLIIFLIIGLFARFNFFIPEIKFYHYIIGFLSVIAGALLWWWVVTYFVDKVRAHFNLRSMWLINKIIGSVIFLFAIVGIITGVTGIANAKVIKSMKNVKIDSGCERVLIDPIAPDQNQNMDIRFRVANLHNEIGKKYSYKDEDGKSSKVIHPGWKLIIEGEAQNWTINIKTKDEKINSDVSSPELIFTLLKDKEKIADRHYATGFNIFNSRNAYAVGIKNGKFKFRGGNRQYNEIFEFDLGSAKVKDISFGVEEGGEIEVSDIIIATSDKYSHTDRVEGGVLEKIRKIARGSTDDLIGVWGLWSYSMDDSYVKPGGEYMIGILPEEIEDESAEASGKSSYRIIYLGGAKVGKDCWKEGMVRGRLTPSLFEGIYNVEWLDSKGDKIKKEIKATISDSELKIQIPEYSSNVTFRKI